MRIIGGRLKGRRLTSFKRALIRPTTDRVREAAFNILAHDFPYKDVLDLFAGTGAMGIEAVSRGAKKAVFVDRDPVAISTIKKNITALGIEENCRVTSGDVLQKLAELKKSDKGFDLIFIDPPYEGGLHNKILSLIGEQGLLNPAGLVVCEASSKEPILLETQALELTTKRRYGDTTIYFFKKSESI